MIARLNKQVFLVLVCEYVSANVCGVKISVSSYSCTTKFYPFSIVFFSSLQLPFSSFHKHRWILSFLFIIGILCTSL